MKKQGFAIATVCCVLSLFASCDLFGPTNANGYVAPPVSLPKSLYPSTATGRTATPMDQAHLIFLPYRSAMYIAASAYEGALSAIKSTTNTALPEGYEDANIKMSGASGTYARRIDLKKGGVVYLTLRYNPGKPEGEFVLDDTKNNPGAPSFQQLKVTYDATSLTVGIIFNDDNNAATTTATKLYLKAAKVGDKVQAAGQMLIDYVWSDLGGTAYTQEHAYGFKAIASEGDASKAIVNLYFPKSSVSSIAETDDIASSWGQVVVDWAAANPTYSVKTGLEVLGINFTSATAFRSSLEAHKNDSGAAALLFLLNLTNPIAYSTTGYVANGSVGTDYTALGSPASVAFPIEPAALKALAITLP